MISSVKLFNTGMAFLFLSFVFYTIFTFSRSKWASKLATASAWLVVVIQGAGFVVRAIEKAHVNMVNSYLAFYKYAPFTNMYESLILFGWSTVLIYLFFERKYKNKSFGMFVMVIALVGEISTQILGFGTQAEPLVPALQSNWLLTHVLTSFLAYAAFAVAAGMAYAYLTKMENSTKSDWALLTISTWLILFFVIYSAYRTNIFLFILISGVLSLGFDALIYALKRYKITSHFPSLNTTEQVMYQSVGIGFVFLTIGIILGAVWAKYAWGGYWSWDPKETWSLITWLVYAAYLHARYVRGLRGKRLVYFTILGFLCVIFTYYGVNLIMPGLHSYAQ